MRITSNWIQEWLRRTMLDDQLMVKALEQAGMEIEQVTYSTRIDERITVCSVKNIVQHPEAHKLKLVDVETGEGQYRVVCGAPNVRVGAKVPFAQIGSVLPGGETIARAKLRGQLSEGMLCSERELGLGEDHNGIMELPNDAAIGVPLCQLFPADTVIDLKTPANRFDVQSVWGLAREVSAIANVPLKAVTPPPLAWQFNAAISHKTPDDRPFLLAHLVLDRPDSPSPHWMQARLTAAGMRPVSPVVDITNYVMLEYGQPLHAYDAAKLQLPLQVRRAKPQEHLKTLDETSRTLSPEDLVIADATGPVGLAGVMGGATSEVAPTTREIWLEAASFDPVRVRKAAQRHGLRTEASTRFERGVPAELPALGMARAVALFQELLGASVVQAVKAGSLTQPQPEMVVDLGQISRLLGFGLSHKEFDDVMKRLQIDIVQSDKASATLRIPWWRPDIRGWADIAEEVVRVLSYDRVPSKIPSWRPTQLTFDRRRAKVRQVRDVLYGAGLFEVMTYSFVSEDQLAAVGHEPAHHLKLKNPLSVEQAYLRSSLLASHLTVAEQNRTYAREVAFYEISNVFVPHTPGELPHEPTKLAALVLAPEHAYRRAKGLLDTLARQLGIPDLTVAPAAHDWYAPGRGGSVRLGDQEIGTIGQLHPRLLRAHKLPGEAAHFELGLDALVQAARPSQFSGLRRFPAITRDIALVVPHTLTWLEIKQVLSGYDVEFVEDYYGKGVPEGQRSLTIRLTLALPDRTPTESEAHEFTDKILHRLERKLHIHPRP
jgi:phenylalanyl-tRNA synthetase beta chain